MSRKKYDVCARVGEYSDPQTGETKARWLNVGAVIQTQNGFCLLLDRTFNPAGLPDPDGRGNVILSLFDANRDQGSRQAPQSSPRPPPPPAPQPVTSDLPHDDVPF